MWGLIITLVRSSYLPSYLGGPKVSPLTLYIDHFGAFWLGNASATDHAGVDLLQSLKQFFINVPYHILVASLNLMALF